MSTTTRKQTPAQARKSALESDFAPLYAVAGLADTFAAQAKTNLIATRERVQTAQGELESGSKARVEEFAKLIKALPEQVKALPEQVKALPETTKAKLVEAQEQFKTLYADAASGYGELAGRGKRAVDEAIGSAKVFGAKAADAGRRRGRRGRRQGRSGVRGGPGDRDRGPQEDDRPYGHRDRDAEGHRQGAGHRAAEDAVAAEKAAARKAAAKKAAATRAAKKTSAAAKAS